MTGSSLPDRMRDLLEGSCEVDSIGMSGSSILLFADRVLKIQDNSEEAQHEIQAMQWLKGRLSVPEVLMQETGSGKSYLLMTRVPGKMSCDKSYMEDPEALTTLLARALRELWQVDISDCPLDWTLDRKLAAARYRVEHGLVDTENVEPETFGPGGFESPEALLQWMLENRPAEDLVLSHGDFCLPNIYIDGGTFHFIDLGRTGVADRWQDIAICYRSLHHNYAGKYGGAAYPDFDPELLFEKLGIAPDWKKIRYYLLLDELF